MNEVIVTIEVEINLTEDFERVKKSVENIIRNAEFDIRTLNRGSLLIARAKGIDSLTKIYNLLRQERILNAARVVLLGGLDEKSVTFYLNKQVAYIGHISFSEPRAESPLGPIKIRMSCDDPRSLIDWLTHRKI